MYSIRLLLFCMFYIGCNALTSSTPPKRASDESVGIVLLDSFTFPTVVRSGAPFFTFVLCFNKAGVGDYGLDSARADYYRMAVDFQKEINEEDDGKILFSQVIVNGATNRKLGEKFGINAQSKNPQFWLINPSNNEIIPYKEPLNKVSFYRYILEHTGITVSLPGTLPEMEQVTKKFVNTVVNNIMNAKNDPDTTTIPFIVEEMNTIVNSLHTENSKQLSTHYIKIVQKIIEKNSIDIIYTEIERLQHILEKKEKIQSNKMKDGMIRLAIWRHFELYIPNTYHVFKNSNKEVGVDNSVGSEESHEF